jgi:hypothetical protein
VKTLFQVSNPQTRHNLFLTHRHKALLLIERQRGRVQRTSRNNHALAAWLTAFHKPKQRPRNAAPNKRRMHHHPMNIKQRATALIRGSPNQLPFNLIPEERLTRVLQRLQRLVQRWNGIAANQVSFPAIRQPLQHNQSTSVSHILKMKRANRPRIVALC